MCWFRSHNTVGWKEVCEQCKFAMILHWRLAGGFGGGGGGGVLYIVVGLGLGAHARNFHRALNLFSLQLFPDNRADELPHRVLIQRSEITQRTSRAKRECSASRRRRNREAASCELISAERSLTDYFLWPLTMLFPRKMARSLAVPLMVFLAAVNAKIDNDKEGK